MQPRSRRSATVQPAETPLEAQRRAIIERNKQRLAALGLLDNPLSGAAEEERRQERAERRRQEEARRQAVLDGQEPATQPERRSRRLQGQEAELPMQKRPPGCWGRRTRSELEAAHAATPWLPLWQPPPLLGRRSFVEQARRDLRLLDDEEQQREGSSQLGPRRRRCQWTTSEAAERAQMDRHNQMRIET